jgi:hypothetical protein
LGRLDVRGSVLDLHRPPPAGCVDARERQPLEPPRRGRGFRPELARGAIREDAEHGLSRRTILEVLAGRTVDPLQELPPLEARRPQHKGTGPGVESRSADTLGP